MPRDCLVALFPHSSPRTDRRAILIGRRPSQAKALIIAAQQTQQGIGIQLGAQLATVQQAVRQGALLAVQGDDLLLNGVLGDQSVNGHRAQLTHAVSSVAGLIFHRRVPPGIEVDHVIRRRQVQTGAAGLEADQEDFPHTGLEGIHARLAFFRRG